VFVIFQPLMPLKKSMLGGNELPGVHITYTGMIGRIGQIRGNF
jgi:hypothetical protein